METIITEKDGQFTAEFNGFTGYGSTKEESEIAVAWAAAHLPLEESFEPKAVSYAQMQENGWN
jgi:hypothetical protein